MCMNLFMASDMPLPLIACDAAAAFSTQTPLTGSEPVLRLFSKPYVYKLGSVYGCACGFGSSPAELDVIAEADWPSKVKVSKFAEYEARRECVRRLKKYSRLAVGTGTAEVYSYWERDEEADPESRLAVTLDHFGGDAFDLLEMQFLTVRSAPGE